MAKPKGNVPAVRKQPEQWRIDAARMAMLRKMITDAMDG